jgi:predicted transcriptional regulator of viral defense system
MCPKKDTKCTKREMPSPAAQRIYLHGVSVRVFSLQDAKAIVGNYMTARKAVIQLVRSGFGVRVYKGLYAAIPPEYHDTGYDVDRYILASRIAGKDGFLAYHSGLEVHGVAQSSFNTVYSISRRRVRPFSFQGIEYKFIQSGHFFGVNDVTRDIVKVRVTDKERTILDCIRRPDLCGGLEEVIKSIEMFRLINTERLAAHLNSYGEQSLIQRAGFVLSLLKDKMGIPDDFLTGLRLSVSKKLYYLVPRMGRGTGRLDRGWNVIAPRNLDEVMRFV